jgi:hypothetical protein
MILQVKPNTEPITKAKKSESIDFETPKNPSKIMGKAPRIKNQNVI